MSQGASHAALGARSVFSRGQRLFLLAGFVLLLAFRLPQAWSHGRFLDEEASVFLAYAWHRPWHDALFRPFAGYWNMAADATTVLVSALVKGGVVTLERAPYLTMTMALAVQTLPGMLILTGTARWLAGRLAVIAALLLVATAPGTEEVFLNVLHIQFHLALCAALILALDIPRRPATRLGYGLLLFLAPLCGPGAIMVLPLFAARGLIDREPARWMQATALAAGTAIQLLVFYGANPMRGHLLDPATIAAMIFVRTIVLPTLGFGAAFRTGLAIHVSQSAGGAGWWWAVAATLALLGLLGVAAARRRDAALWLASSGVAIAATSFGFGMVVHDRLDLFSVGAGERYDFLPEVLLGLSLIALAMRPRQWTGRTPLAGLACTLVLATGAIGYLKPFPAFATGPSWPAEVVAWRRDHSHPLAVWPQPWTADLSDTSRPCTPIGRDPTRSNDPRYCESGWVAAFFYPQPTR